MFYDRNLHNLRETSAVVYVTRNNSKQCSAFHFTLFQWHTQSPRQNIKLLQW